MVVGIDPAAHETGLNRTIRETDCAVVAEEQELCDVADCRTSLVFVASDRQEQLVLRSSEPHRLGLFLAPVKEPAKLGAEGEEPLVVVVVESIPRHRELDRTTICMLCGVGSGLTK